MNMRAVLPQLTFYLHDDPSEFRIELAGTLAAGNAAELDRCWRTGSSTLGTRAFVVKLGALKSVDDAGRRLLVRWKQLGALFVAESAEGRSILELIRDTALVEQKAANY